MAATREKATPASKEKKVKKTNDRIVKRPTRGFHRFRSGILNVTPKGGEKELVRNNQNSPLLRLPPELRGRIWEFAIGANVLRTVYACSPTGKSILKVLPPVEERENGLALLRTCRQIYSETALLPYKSSIYSSDLFLPLKYELRCLKRFQLAQIEDLQVESELPYDVGENALWRLRNLDQFPILPGLKRIHLLIFRVENLPENQFEDGKKSIRTEIERLLVGKDIGIMLEDAKMSKRAYGARWRRPEE